MQCENKYCSILLHINNIGWFTGAQHFDNKPEICRYVPETCSDVPENFSDVCNNFAVKSEPCSSSEEELDDEESSVTSLSSLNSSESEFDGFSVEDGGVPLPSADVSETWTQCFRCKHIFGTQTEYVMHLYVCAGAAALKCCQCEFKTRDKEVLERHHEEEHVVKAVQKTVKPRGRKPKTDQVRLPCGQCRRTFKEARQLDYHLRRECGRPPRFVCALCTYRTNQKAQMRMHEEKVHNQLSASFVQLQRPAFIAATAAAAARSQTTLQSAVTAERPVTSTAVGTAADMTTAAVSAESPATPTAVATIADMSTVDAATVAVMAGSLVAPNMVVTTADAATVAVMAGSQLSSIAVATTADRSSVDAAAAESQVTQQLSPVGMVTTPPKCTGEVDTINNNNNNKASTCQTMAGPGSE
ncbi:zinc finger protein 335-like [Nilaparvata lugens]|uniref:zinc finger protein 335-like n=1 Tax=Nilaparvata lugens TaxID=108931 RepID=UPI00193E78B5|nr:zinc finger protein 335-like [Nilaparvata lugens]